MRTTTKKLATAKDWITLLVRIHRSFRIRLFHIWVNILQISIHYYFFLNPGLILIVTKNEEWTFWLLKILIEDTVQNYHTKTMRGLIIDIGVLRELIDMRAPEICEHLDRVGMPFPVVTTKWFICMFSEVLPVETVLRVWDCLFLEGSKVSDYLHSSFSSWN